MPGPTNDPQPKRGDLQSDRGKDKMAQTKPRPPGSVPGPEGGATMPNDDGVFAPLLNCGDTLRAAKVLDRIPYYRFVALEMSADGGGTQPAIFPVDYALPRVVKSLTVDGWPPENLTAARGGRPLVDRWKDAAPDAVAPALTRFTIDDIDVFLADPRVPSGTRRRGCSCIGRTWTPCAPPGGWWRDSRTASGCSCRPRRGPRGAGSPTTGGRRAWRRRLFPTSRRSPTSHHPGCRLCRS